MEFNDPCARGSKIYEISMIIRVGVANKIVIRRHPDKKTELSFSYYPHPIDYIIKIN